MPVVQDSPARGIAAIARSPQRQRARRIWGFDGGGERGEHERGESRPSGPGEDCRPLPIGRKSCCVAAWWDAVSAAQMSGLAEAAAFA